MSAHKGRCFRALRQTKRRKAKQAARNYTRPLQTAGTQNMAERFMEFIFNASALNSQIQARHRDLKAQLKLQKKTMRHQSRGG